MLLFWCFVLGGASCLGYGLVVWVFEELHEYRMQKGDIQNPSRSAGLLW